MTRPKLGIKLLQTQEKGMQSYYGPEMGSGKSGNIWLTAVVTITSHQILF